MKTIFIALACALLMATLVRAADVAPLKVLYAGNPGSPREADFCALLENNFAKVGKAKLTDVTTELAKDYDVVVLDWTTIFVRDDAGKIDQAAPPSINMPPIPQLGDDYDRPTILIGAVAGHFGNENKLKISWLCLCLDDAAHGMKREHDIFNKPNKVKIELVDRPTPQNYREFPEGAELGDTMKVLAVQTKKYPEIDPGLVANPYGFEDSPDAEAISSGLNMKGPESVAIGRQGNFFQWGFSASPSEMTEPARAIFVNAVHYIRKFDGQRPLVRRVSSGREVVVTMVAGFNKYPQIREYIGPEILSVLGNDPDKFVEDVKANLEYIRAVGEYKFDLDTDVKPLGTSNRKLELLEKCVAMLEKNDQPELATRVLKRYTSESFETPAQWRKWLNENRDKMFFTDVGGFKWVVKR